VQGRQNSVTKRRDYQPNQPGRQAIRPRSPSEALEPGRAPARPRGGKIRNENRRVGGLVRVISGLFTLVLVGMGGMAALGALLYHLYERPGPLEVSRTVAIPKGEGRIEIAERLERDGVISNRWAFVASHLMQSWIGRGAKNLELKAGEYEIKKSASMREVVELIAEGKSVLYKISLPEGLTSQQIVERLKAEPNLTGDITEVPAEGTLLPDTYRFSKGMARQEILDRMKAEQQRLITSLWENRSPELPVDSPDKAVILASIVEKETGRADERHRVAAVFVNRLRKPMRLQSDPTIIYGIVGGQGSLGRPISRDDIEQKTAYNTYRINGLPPGPICNPGRPAIEATLNPAKTDDLYFVADGTGGHAFSKTLDDHNDAVANWRKVERDQRAKEADVAPGAATSSDKSAEKVAEKSQKAEPANTKPTVLNQAGKGVPSPPAEAAGEAAAPAAGEPVTATASTLPLPVRKPKR
jgi:UPF0755 protein